MAKYVAVVSATSNSSANTDDSFIDLTAAASNTLILRRVRISTQTAATDDSIRIRIYRKTASGAGSTTGTAVRVRPLAPAATVGVKIKNGTSTFATGTTTDQLTDIQLNGRSVLDMPVEFESASAGIIGVNIARSNTSVVTNVFVEWEE